MPLGDKKPSQLYHDMVHAAQNAMSESALLDLWYTRLPESVASSAMTVTSSTLDKLRLADITFENWQLRNIHAVNATSTASCVSKPSPDLETFFAQFAKWMSDNQPPKQHNSRPRERSKSQNRQKREVTPKGNRRDEPVEQFHDCWYHRTYGNKATNCRKPCKFRVAQVSSIS